MFKFISNLFNKPAPAPVCNCPPPVSTNPLDLGNGVTVTTVDDFSYIVANVNIPNGGFVSFKVGGREVFRIDRDGGRNI